MTKIKLRTVVICTLLLGFSNFYSVAQVPFPKVENSIKPDPEAGNLGKYGNYNLNLSTGQIDISVPIVELEGVSLKYPISLSYDHKGIPVQERATSAGMNWNFNASGVITKSVSGLPDEKATNGFNDNYLLVNGTAPPPALYNPSSFSDIYYRAALGFVDLEPDIFSFSFNGRSGKFIYNPGDDKFYCIPYSKLLIQKVVVPNDGYYFTITDENGYKYIFDRRTQTSFESVSSTSQNDNSGNYKGQWYLTQILSPDGIVEFEFEFIDDNLLNDVERNSYSRTYLQSAYSTGPYCSDYTSPIMNLSGSGFMMTSIQNNSLLISKVKSPFEDLKIVYANRTDQSKRIDSIILIKKDNSLRQSWRLYHGYYSGGGKLRLDSINLFAVDGKVNGYKFEYHAGDIPGISSKAMDHWGFANGTGSPTSLFPKIWYGMQYIGDVNRDANEFTKNGILTKIYFPTGGFTDFEYELNDYSRTGNGSGGTPVSVPVYSTSNTSINRRTSVHGAGTSTQSFTMNATGIVHISSRRDNCDGNPPIGTNCTIEPCQTMITLNGPGVSNLSLNGAIGQWVDQDLQLGAGTYTISISTNEQLDYGMVYVSYPQLTSYNVKPMAGGLRIKKIKNNDLITAPTVKSFTYIDASEPTRSSGYVPELPEYTYVSRLGLNCQGSGSAAPACDGANVYVNMSSQSNTQLFFSDGSPVAYTRVKEIIGENGEGGYIDHRFSFFNDGQQPIFPYPSSSSYSWKRGLPLQKLYYNSSNQLVKEEINQYTFETSQNYLDLKGLKFGIFFMCPYRATNTELVSGLTHFVSQWSYMNKSTIKTYPDDGGDPLVEETSYFYDNPSHIQPTRIQTVQSDGSIKQIRTRYPMDYAPSGSSSNIMVNALNKMIQKNIIATPIEQIETVIRNGQETIVAASLATFKEFETDKVYPWQYHYFSISAPTAYLSLSGISSNVFTLDNRYVKKMEYFSYNSKGKPLQIKDETDRNYSVTYGYNGQLPLAFTKNAAANQVYFNGFEEEISGTSTTSKYGQKGYNGPYTVNGSLLMAGSYILNYWQWDGASWHYMTQNINHNGSSAITVSTFYVIDELTIRPVSSDISTFSYDPSIGRTAKSVDNGTGIKFEMDNLGRLLQVRDHKNNILKKYTYQYQGAQ